MILINVFDPSIFRLRPFPVQGQEAAEDLPVGEIRGVVVPAVGGGDGPVKVFPSQFQPGGHFILEVGQGALLPGRSVFWFG